MAGLNPSTLLKVRDAKSTLTTPTAEGVKGTAAASYTAVTQQLLNLLASTNGMDPEVALAGILD